MRHAPKSAHLEFFDFLSAENLEFQADFLRHLFRAVRQDGRGHSVRRLIHQFAREILRFADDPGFVQSILQFRFVAVCHHGDRIDALIFAVALVRVGIEIADKRAFDDGSHRGIGGDAGLRREKGKTPQSARFEGSHRGSGQAAAARKRKKPWPCRRRAEAAVWPSAWPDCAAACSRKLCRYFAAGDECGRRMVHGAVAGFDRNFRFGIWRRSSRCSFSERSSITATRQSVSVRRVRQQKV